MVTEKDRINKFADMLAEQLKLRNMSQGELAKCLGISVKTVNHWINRNRRPTWKTIKQITDMFDLNYYDYI